MAKSLMPRTPIPIFNKRELDEADLCARALWHGINFKTGRVQTSDAHLLDRFATPFYNIPTNAGLYKTSPIDRHELLIACELKVLYKGVAGLDFNNGDNCISSDIYKNIYPYWLTRTTYAYSHEIYGAEAVRRLSSRLAKPPSRNRIVLASRMMFFIAPDMQCFNMNNKVAIAFGLQVRPHYYRSEYCSLMAVGLKANNALLTTYKVPALTDGINEETWSKAYSSDWWQRRVMDIAILIRLKLASPKAGLYGTLATYLAEKGRKSSTR